MNCGSGTDRAVVDRADRVKGCERVRRRARRGSAPNLRSVPRLWVYTMAVIIACCVASMVIAIVKLA